MALTLSRSPSNDLIEAAYHEAGHVVVGALRMREIPLLVSVQPRSTSGHCDGVTRWSRPPVSKEAVEKLLQSADEGLLLRMRKDHESLVQTVLAGPVVDSVRDADVDLLTLLYELQDAGDMGDVNDLTLALDLLAPFEADDRRRWDWMWRIAKRTDKLVRSARAQAAIDRVAEALAKHTTLDRQELERLLGRIAMQHH